MGSSPFSCTTGSLANGVLSAPFSPSPLDAGLSGLKHDYTPELSAAVFLSSQERTTFTFSCRSSERDKLKNGVGTLLLKREAANPSQ